MSFYSDTILDDSPVVYMKLNDSSAPITEEIGTVPAPETFGNPTFNEPTALISGTSVTLAAEDGFDIGDNNTTKFTGAFTVELWVKHTISNFNNIGIIEAPGDNNAYSLQNSEGAFRFNIGGTDNNLRSTTNVNDDQWHHVVFIYTGGDGNGKVFIDANDSTDFDNSGTPSYNTGPLHIGWAGGRFEGYTGSLDQVALYDYALTAEQVQTHFDAASIFGVLTGTVEGETEASTIAATVRAYRKDTGQLVGEQVLGDTESSFSIDTEFDEPHTIIALPPDGENLQALTLSNIEPEP